MDGFKNSTKTQYSMGGACKGPRGAAAVSKASKAFREGGAVSSRPTTRGGRTISDEELSTPERILAKSGRADPYERMPQGLPKPKTRRMPPSRDVREPLVSNPLMDKLSTVPSQRGEFPIRRARGGLAAMPKGGKK